MDENFHNIQKRNNSTNRNISNNNLLSKESVKVNSNMRLSDSNIELNIEEPKIKDLRCLNCYLIPFLTLNSSSHSININCNFGHSTSLELEEYLKKGYDNNFNNLACSKCKTKILKNEKNFVYCKECSELLCKNCILKHNTLYEDNHHMVHLDKFDTTCILHNETYDYFCLDCKKNICQYCFDEFHNEHKLVDLDDINLKRKEIKKIKENFIKEKENYLNIPKILNELITKLKNEIDMIINNVENEIKFKESIINTYENKIDNYNAIINLKNLGFNAEPFNIDKNVSMIDNLVNLMKYLKIKGNKIELEKKDNLPKTPERVKLKKKKISNKPPQSMANTNKITNNVNNVNKNIINNANNNANKNIINNANNNVNNNVNNNANNVNNNIDDNNSNNKKDNSNINNVNIIKDAEIINNQDKENEKDFNKELNKDNNNNNKVYKKNFIPKKINYGNSNANTNDNINENNINITNDINSGNNKKNLSRITEDESSNNQNTNNNISNSKDIKDNAIKREDLSIPINSEKGNEEKEKETEKSKIVKEKDEKEIYNLVNNINMQEENIKQNNNSINNKKNINTKNINENNINNKFTSNSTNNLNYVRSEASNLKMAVKSNKNNQIDKNNDLGKRQSKEINSHSQKILNQVSNDPFSLKNQFNENNENINREKNIIKDMNAIQSNRNIKVEDDEDEETNEEEEEEEDDEDEEEEEDDEDSENDEETEENEEEEKFVKKNKNIQMSRKNRNKEYPNMENEEQNNKQIAIVENDDSSFRHKKIFPKSSISSDNNISELFGNKKNRSSKNNSNNKEKMNSNEKNNEQIRMIRNMNINEFRPNGSTLKIKESDNTVCCMLEVRDNIFACGFLLGEIDVYDVNYLNCLFTIYEHKSRVSNMVLLKDRSLLTSSFDYTMKKIRITNNNSYIVDFVFSSFKNPVYKGIELTNNNIVSISFRGSINIFKKTDKNNNYLNFISHEIADEEIYNVIELIPNKEMAFSTDECLRFFSMDNYQNIGNVYLLEFAKGNNLIHLNKNILFVLLKHDIGMINIPQRQCIFKCSLGEVGKPECFCYLKDNTILVGISNNIKENKKIEFLFKQFSIKMTKLKLIAEKMEIIDKKKKDDYFRITSLIELKNNVIAYGTAGFEEFKLVGNISIID